MPGSSSDILKLKDQILRYNTQLDEVKTILLLGETGVGKTYIAEVIAKHRCWLDLSFLKDDDNRRLRGDKLEEIRTIFVKNEGETIFEEAGQPYRELSIPLLEGHLALSQLFGHVKGAFTGAVKQHEGFLCKKEVQGSEFKVQS